MTIHCYRCGRPVTVTPKVQSMQVDGHNNMTIEWQDTRIGHACPQDKK
jgi:hypothetical protein